MPSPFPGMDPYIEACGLWADFHRHLIEGIAAALADAVPERYLVRTEERNYLLLAEAEGKEKRPFIPDVSVEAPASAPTPGPQAAVAVREAAMASEPIPMSLEAVVEEEFREGFIEIYESRPEWRLVTTVEVLSPSNKEKGSYGWHLYLRKRQGVLLDRVNLVEIDLLRLGSRMPMRGEWPKSPYTLLVRRGSDGRRCAVWPASYRTPVPTLPVPLVAPDADVRLDLHPLIGAVYHRYRYARSIDYTQPLRPPLAPEDTTWLAERLRAAGPTP